ncbi:hypothetical protein FRC00_003964 [Tulasnella sp. 408]|nr:hypothetical protein FRC00_003964 [Tulasnella sp. 408]
MSQNTPRELWREIFTTMRDGGDDDWQDLSKGSQHQHRSTLVPLLLTCRYFRNIAEPLLYEHAVLYVNKEGSRSGTLVDALKAREERRGWVKTVVATRRPTGRKDRDDELPTEESILIQTALAFIPGLQGLRLFRTLISDEIYHWVLTHPTLRTLILQRCDFTQKGRHKIDLTQSNVTRLTLSQSSPFLKFPFGEVSKLFALRRLQEFTVTVPFFNHIATLLSALPTPALHDLRRLSIELPSGSTSVRDRRGFAVQLFPFLLHSPNLTHLLMQPGVTVPPSGIFQSRLEHLKVLQAPAEVVAALRTDAKALDTLTMNGILGLNIAPSFGGTIRHLTLDIGTDVVASSVLECPKLLSLVLRLRPENAAIGLTAMPHAVSVLLSPGVDLGAD